MQQTTLATAGHMIHLLQYINRQGECLLWHVNQSLVTWMFPIQLEATWRNKLLHHCLAFWITECPSWSTWHLWILSNRSS